MPREKRTGRLCPRILPEARRNRKERGVFSTSLPGDFAQNPSGRGILSEMAMLHQVSDVRLGAASHLSVQLLRSAAIFLEIEAALLHLLKIWRRIHDIDRGLGTIHNLLVKVLQRRSRCSRKSGQGLSPL